MLEVFITDEVKAYAWKLACSGAVGHSGDFDGSRDQQYVGFIGEVITCDLFKQTRPMADGPDGGLDLLICEKRVDVKTMGRTVNPRPDFVSNYLGKQLGQDTDYFIFCSINKTTSILFYCGIITRPDFLIKAKEYKPGKVRKRSNGTEFEVVAPLWEIFNDRLWAINKLGDISEYIEGTGC